MLRTRPAFAITCRCLVIAWRLMSKSAVNWVIDSGPSFDRRETRRRRVSSPNAAKTDAESDSSAIARALAGMGQMFLDERNDHAPSFLVRAERLGAARERNAIEAGLDHGEQDAVYAVFQRERDQRRRLARVVDVLLMGEGMPAERKDALRFDRLDGDFERQAFVRFLGLRHVGIDRGRGDDPSHERSLGGRAPEFDAEQGPDLPDGGERAPDSRPRRPKGDLLLDPIANRNTHMQPHGCPYYTDFPRSATIWLQMSPAARL